METTTTLRNASLEDLTATLRDQQERKVDLVVPSSKLDFQGGAVRVALPEPELTDTGVIDMVTLNPDSIMVDQLAGRADVPTKWMRNLYQQGANKVYPEGLGRSPFVTSVQGEDLDGLASGRVIKGDWTDLLDFTLRTAYRGPGTDGERMHLVRGFRNDDGTGVGRAILSNRFRAIDNLDILMATLTGIATLDADVNVTQCNLSPRSMRVRFNAPTIGAQATELLRDYRTPFEDRGSEHGQTGLRDEDGNLPVSAGFEISNSEVGGGSAKITPILTVKVCTNGMVLKSKAQGHRHVGGKLKEGAVNWSDATQRKAIELITAQTTDLVKLFLSPEFVAEQVAELTAKAGKPVERPTETIERLGSRLAWNEEEQDQILAMFIKGGQSTSGGVMQAVTAAAQVISDPDRAWEIESQGIEAMELV